MRRDCLRRFTDSLAILATVAVIPTLAFASSALENTTNDAVITAKIKKLKFPLDNINVETHQGIVYLSGTVESVEQRDKLIQLTKSVNGVRDIVFTLKHKGEAL